MPALQVTGYRDQRIGVGIVSAVTLADCEPLIAERGWVEGHPLRAHLVDQPDVGGYAAFTPEVLAETAASEVRWNGSEVVLLFAEPVSLYRIENYQRDGRCYIARRVA